MCNIGQVTKPVLLNFLIKTRNNIIIFTFWQRTDIVIKSTFVHLTCRRLNERCKISLTVVSQRSIKINTLSHSAYITRLRTIRVYYVYYTNVCGWPTDDCVKEYRFSEFVYIRLTT